MPRSFEQYQGAPASKEWLRYYVITATDAFGDEAIGDLNALDVSRWHGKMPETMRYGAHRAPRQVLAAAVHWQWIERNVALDVKQPQHPKPEFVPFESWDEVDAVAAELGPFEPVAIFGVGTRRPAGRGVWRRLDRRRPRGGRVHLRRTYAKAKLKTYAKTAQRRCRVPIRRTVIASLETLPRREGSLFPAAGAGGSTSTTGALASGRRR